MSDLSQKQQSNIGAVMRCFDCQFIRKMKSGKDWCINDKSWLVGWITDVLNQGCEHHVRK
jgi:hypothetical protein